MTQRFKKTQLVQVLERHVGAPVGMRGLNILVYGWRRKHRFTDTAIYQRDYLTYPETESLSVYAGYDLTA
ncbi:MAG: hypothetical protein IJ814_04320 [Paludibacteraceae bacterium]|nr:hypothetical protein [Paludibacteraceae bacterium]